MMIEYCQAEDIRVILIKTPIPQRTKEQPYYNTVSEIADEYGIPFINFNLLDAETGFEAGDFYVDNYHINTTGARKISSYLGNYIMSNYTLLDHRGDAYYQSWDIFANNKENDYLRRITGADDYFAELARDGRIAVIMKQDVPEGSEAYASFLQKLADTGMDVSFLAEEGKSCYVADAAGKQQYDCTQECSINIDGMDIMIDFAHSGTVTIDGDEAFTLPKSGVVCMVYDPFSQEMVDTVVFSEDTQYTAVHQQYE